MLCLTVVLCSACTLALLLESFGSRHGVSAFRGMLYDDVWTPSCLVLLSWSIL